MSISWTGIRQTRHNYALSWQEETMALNAITVIDQQVGLQFNFWSERL